jgi:hypothetical protein
MKLGLEIDSKLKQQASIITTSAFQMKRHVPDPSPAFTQLNSLLKFIVTFSNT